MLWYKTVIAILQASGLFSEITLVGGKVRAFVDEARFLDIHFDPTTSSYSYALVDLRLPYSGDKRVFGWDDYPHEGVAEMRQLGSYPHHYFQKRTESGSWVFEVSAMRGSLEHDRAIVVSTLKFYLGQ